MGVLLVAWLGVASCDSVLGIHDLAGDDDGGGDASDAGGDACVPDAYACAGRQCGSAVDSCGESTSCGICSSGTACQNGQCVVPCAPADTQIYSCACSTSGEISDSWFGIGESCPFNCPAGSGSPVTAAAFVISSRNVTGTEALYRCVYKDSNGDFRWYVDVDSHCHAVPGATVEATLGYVYKTATCGASALNRFYDATYQNRWSTHDASPPPGYQSPAYLTGYGW